MFSCRCSLIVRSQGNIFENEINKDLTPILDGALSLKVLVLN